MSSSSQTRRSIRSRSCAGPHGLPPGPRSVPTQWWTMPRSAPVPGSGPSATCGRARSSARGPRPGRSSRSRTPRSAPVRRCRISRTSATPRSARTRTWLPATSRPTTLTSPELAQKIAEKLGIQVGDVSLRSFASGETYCRYEESIRGADLFIVQTSSPPVDQHLMELLIMIDAAKLASAKRITAVLPLYPYSRQDKKSRPREPITAKLVAEMVQSAGADRVLTMDLHAGQVQGFFEVPVDHMTALPMLAQYFRDLGLPEELVAVAPDTGRTRLASKFAEMIGGDLAVLQKDRPAHNVAHITNVIGDVE